MMVYRPVAQPYCVHHTFDSEAARNAVSHYVEATYVLNPVYNAFLTGLRPGIYRITELAPDAYFSSEILHNLKIGLHSDEELGYRTPGWPAGLAELIVAVGLPNGEMLEISLSRPASEGYADGCINRMRMIEPVISALFNLYWTQARARLSQSGHSLSLDDLLRDFGRDTLTRRERDVAQLILKGHSGESISLRLDISRTTVKSHRQNIYAKLNVTTQQELFSHFIKSLPLASA
jgi:DNA-binding CsgD family transcriptional regulator